MAWLKTEYRKFTAGGLGHPSIKPETALGSFIRFLVPRVTDVPADRVFFPAAGNNGGNDAGSNGNYWSGESDGDDNAYVLNFNDGNADVNSNNVNNEYSVRLVRGL